MKRLAAGQRRCSTAPGNIFGSPQTMPSWLRAAANLNPVTHLVTADRGQRDDV
jgi:hypothetical protein